MNGFVGAICAILVSFLAFTLPGYTPVTHSSIEPEATVERLTRLRRGINTSHWFAQVSDKRGYNKSHFDKHTTADDIALIKAMGFDHIRFGLELAPMFNANAPESLPGQYLGYVDQVTCNEFGVYRRVVSAVDRGAWIRDVRNAMEKYEIGWTMWDYQGGFNVVNKGNGRAIP